LSAAVGEEAADRVRLAASELVSNVVVHAGLTAGSRIGLAVDVVDDLVHVAVDQGSSTAGTRVIAAEDRGLAGGFGLAIVADIADRWGVDIGPPGRVWFEIDRPH
jgi:anti-sigma regulatory factor (Ser/Thr protein kinase)